MAAGGYIYEQIDLAYDSGTNGATVRSWALAVHLARCKAFMAAAARENNGYGGVGWSSVQTSLYDEITESYMGEDIYIQDIHPTSVDTSEEYPAFVSFFRCNNADYSEYCIITYSGFNAYDSYSDPTSGYSNGLYMPQSSLQRGSTNNTYVSCGGSMAHAFASAGFGNHDVCSSGFLTTGCTHIMPAHMALEGSYYNYNQSNDSLVGARSNNMYASNLVSKTYQFGFAVKGTHIIALERRSDADGWLWSIIGDIFDALIASGDTYRTGCIVNDYYSNSSYETGSTHKLVIENNGNPTSRISFCNTSGVRYKPSNANVYLGMTRSCSDYVFNPCARTDKTTPTDTRYNAVGVGALCNHWYSATGDPGVDGDANGGKGFISTDILRQVSAGVCQTAGATFQSGNFVAMASYHQYATVGWLLGWDASNASII